MPTIEPRPSIANAVIEDRNRAPSATLEHDRLPMPNCPHELSGLAFNAMLDETRQEVAREGTHDIDDVLAEMDAIIDAAARDQANR